VLTTDNDVLIARANRERELAYQPSAPRPAFLTRCLGPSVVVAIICAGPHALIAGQQTGAAETAARAREAMQAQRYDDAVKLYEELVRTSPGTPGLRLNLGIALHSAGRYERARVELQRVVAEQPSLTPAWLMLGLTRLKLGDAAGAIGPLQRVVQTEPGNGVARLELAAAQLELGRFVEAAREFDRLTTLDPGQPKAWLGLGRSYTLLARAAFEQLEREAPGSAYGAALLARSRASQQQYRGAFRLYRQALASDPRLRGVHAALAEIYRAAGHPDWAAEEERREGELPALNCAQEPLACDFMERRYRALLERLSSLSTPEALYWQSLTYSQLAADAFARLEALPPSPESHALRAEAYRIRGLHDLSIKEWTLALERSPGDRRLQRELAESHWLNQDYAIARPLLEKLLQDAPDSAALNYELGDTLLNLQLPDEAIPRLEKALAHEPDRQAARVALARAYARLAQWDRAIPHLQATIGADQDGSLHLLLARGLAATGREGESAPLIARAQELAAAAAARREQTNQDVIAPP
jgi:predicted Zn-dependent protease